MVKLRTRGLGYPRDMDDDWPGPQFRGATWVEFYGGPWDGTMTEEKEVPLQLLGKINVSRGTSQAYQDGSTPPLGEYVPVGWLTRTSGS